MLSISHINILSLPKHFDKSSHSPYLMKHDIIGISETWLNSSHFSSAYTCSLLGYSLVRRDCELTCPGGGVAFYVRNHIKYERVNLASSGTAEVFAIDVVSCKSKF